MIATFSYCWNKNADSVLPVRALKSIFSALKALFCGYSIDIASQENQSLIACCGNSLFSCAVLRIQERRTAFITPNALFSVLNGITRDEKELLADKKEDDNGVHKKNVQCDKPQNNDNFIKSECQKTILVRDVFLSRPPNVTTIDEAKKLLK